MPDSERRQTLHDHYASNAKARGHAPECEMVTDTINWPTMTGRPACTCGLGKM